VPEYYDNRGLSLAAYGEYDKAIADYDQAAAAGTAGPTSSTKPRRLLPLKGELGAALSDYEAALKLDPNFALTYNNRAVLYKKWASARRRWPDYETALRLDPATTMPASGRAL